ncbi:sialoadhesin [Rhineura floridana]|uniref:sialoadhesin n=1 Tax=Rhineura floridana TaxID=261503 RepID=UPI002AC7F24F|nr:sialoadhesin [Rhineura floridana]XP_061439627.1 sialoadhesin [Rhineura floridana]
MSLLPFLFVFANYVIQAFASWSVTYPEHLWSVRDSCVLIPCTFSYPSDVAVTGSITAIWYKGPTSERTVVYHSATPDSVEAQFRGRTKLLGDPLAQNCTLVLRNVTNEDSGKYYFRFEISEGNRWSDQKGVELTVTDTPNVPTIASPEDLHEGVPVSFNCSSPYVCPHDSISLRWLGYDMETSFVSGMVQLDTTAGLRKQTLSTSFSWKYHNRQMSCEVSVGEQARAGKIKLSVKHSPKGVKVSLNPSTKNIRVGDAVSLTCTVHSSYPDVTAYRWFKDGASCGNEAVKTIQSASREDYGLYRCEAENSVGTGVAEGVTLYVFSAVLSVSPSSSVREGEMATLTCDVPGEDKQEIHYSWYKNNIWIKEGKARILVFHEVAVGDTGYYTCKVQNDKGSEMSQAVSLSVFYPPRPPSLTLFQETQKGQLAIIYCTVDSNPQSSLSLYQDKRLIATSSSHSAPSQRISVTTTRNSLKMEIQKVVPEDKGEYQCVATNMYGNATTARFFGAQTARVVASPSQELPEGERVTLTCIATLGPGDGTTYMWYKNAKWLQEEKENSLVFSAVASGDAGTYHCVAQNKKGSNTSPAISLRIFYPPRQPVVRSFLETQGGHLGIIQCTADSEPPSEIALFKGDILVGSTNIAHSPADPRVSVISSYNTLKVNIKDVTVEDEGEYVCSAQNCYGESTVSMDFTAETARIVIKPSTEVCEGKTVHLSCEVSSSDSTSSNYTWYRDGLQLLEAHGVSLEFQQVTRSDSGVYYCRVENQKASKSSTFITLSVLYPPGRPRVAVFAETERGRVAIFQCSVDSNPPSKLVLYKGGEIVASSSSEGSVAPQRVSITAAHNAMRVEMREIVPADQGSYNVTATNTYGSSSRLLYFHVQTARVLVTPSPELLEGNKVTLTCDVMGSAPDDSTFSWYKNSKRIPESNTSMLTFLRVTSRDAGSYHCKAHTPDEASFSVSPSVSITVFYPPQEPQVTSFLQTEGRQVAIIHCTAESEPQSQMAISKGGKLLASTAGSSRTRHPRVGMSASYNSLRVEILDVVMEDEGEYLCSAANAYGNASSSVKLIAETARIWISPPDVLEGNTVNLTCAVASDAAGEPHYTWYKNSRWYAEGPSKMLALPHATVADSGSYYCTVKNGERVRNSSLGTLNVLYPPRDAWVKSFLETKKGMVAIIVCTVDSNPPSTLLLHRGNKVLAGSSFPASGAPDRKLSAASSPNSLRLEITDVGLDDEGMYECSASNAIGESVASLAFTVETTRVVIKPVADVHEGSRVSLTCEDKSSPSGAVYTWYKNTRWLSEGSAPSLVFQAVASSNMGSYSCQVQNERGIRKSLPAALRVLYAPKKPSLMSFLETHSGSQAIIQCTVESHPSSEITLYRENVVVASSRSDNTLLTQRLNIYLAHNSLKVEIKKILLEDEGHYRCLANNTYGTSMASVHFSVESARVTIEPSPDVQERATANLTCVVASRAVGEMNYTWYKNSKWFRDGPEQSLFLEHVVRDNAGSYHCQAMGRTGTVTSALVILNVLYAPNNPSISTYLDNQNGKVGIIDCKVDSHPRSTLALYKGDQLVADTNSSHSAAGRRFRAFPSYNSLRLEILDLMAEDSGRYRCHAGNQYGKTNDAIDFTAETLSDLHLFQILAGIFIALACAALLCALVLGVQTQWIRMNEEWKKWRQQKSKKVESAEVENKEETVQLNEQSPETPPSGRFCLSYRKLHAKTETPPKEVPPEQSCTSIL